MRLLTLLSIAIVLTCTTIGGAAAQETRLDELREAARHNRRDAGAQAAYGRALLRAGRYRQAEQALRAAARLQRGDQQALFDVARVAFARGEYRPARNACRPLEREDRNSSLARVCRARAFLVWNRSARAFEELEAVLESDPDNYEALLALGDAHRLRADVAEAESAYRRAASAKSDKASPYLGLGRLYAAAGRTEDAVRALRRALELDPTHPEIQYELGKLLGGSAQARRLLEQAVAGRPDWAEAQVALASALLDAGEFGAAEAAFERAVELADTYAMAHLGLGRARAGQGEFEGAQEAIERAIELVPNSQEAALALAKLYEATERESRAFAQYRHAADLDPRNPEPLLDAARLALREDRDVLAVGFLDRVLQQHANLAEALRLYGDAMAARGNRDEARQYYQRALRGEGEVDRSAVNRALRELGNARRGRATRRR